MLAFMEKWFPEQIDYPIHAEGFVYLDETNGQEVDYSKIKLPIYYLARGINGAKIGKLVKFPLTVDVHFPQVTIVRAFYQQVISETIAMLKALLAHVKTLLVPGSPLFANHKEAARKRFEAAIEAPEDKALNSVMWRMVFNTSEAKDALVSFIAPQFEQYGWGAPTSGKLSIIFGSANCGLIWENEAEGIEGKIQEYLSAKAVGMNMFEALEEKYNELCRKAGQKKIM
jgi:hypothetical protein